MGGGEMGIYRNFWFIGGVFIGFLGDVYLKGGGLLEDLRLYIVYKGFIF